MTLETMRCCVEVWPVAADEHAICLVSGGDAWRSPSIPSDSEPHWEAEFLIAGHEQVQPVLLHSTSWRAEGPTVVLTYVAVFACEGLVLDRWSQALPISTDLLPTVGKPYRHGAAEVPIPRYVDVLLHALRHCRLLRDTDAVAKEVLSGHWAAHLDALEPALSGMYQ